MNIKRINVSFAKEAIQDKDFFNFYAISVMVKEKFSSSCVHNYTKNGLSRLLGISATTLGRAISVGLKLGYCRIEGTNLIFNKISKKDRRMVDIEKFGEIPKEFKEVKYFIKKMMVVDKLRVMNYWGHPNLGKKCKQKCGQGGQQAGISVISYKGLSKMLSCSKPTAIKIINDAVRTKFIRKQVFKMRLGESLKSQGIFSAYGKTFRQPVNRYFEISEKVSICQHIV